MKETVGILFTRYLGSFPRINNETWVLIGQDGGQSIDLGEKTLFVFSDTLLTPLNPSKQGRLHQAPFRIPLDNPTSFVANCAGLTEGAEVRQALAGKRYYSDADGLPLELLQATPEEAAAGIRFWPGHGVFIDGEVYLYYLGIQKDEGDSIWDFHNLGAGLAVLDPASGRCRRLRETEEWRFWNLPADEPLADDFHFGVQVIRQADEVFVFGSFRHRLQVRAFVGRVAPDQITNPAAYRYFYPASGEWSAELTTETSLGPSGSDYSVSYNPYLGQYLMVYINSYEKTLWWRTAEALTGPYSKPQLIGRVPHEASSELVYLAFEHAKFAKEGGRRIFISYCQPYFVPNALVEICFA
jgi:hypothetical protein